MASRLWYGPQPESTERKEELENLFVFGYHCKVFHDDEKAAYIDRGDHLIPWMGDSTLMIDRYDGRGSLYDLHNYDAEQVRTAPLSPEDEELERLCDEERYLELHTDVVEKEHYEEEEMKRLNEALQSNSYGAVAFNYDQSIGVGVPEEAKPIIAEVQEEEEEEDVFESPPELQCPLNMIVPKTNKHNAIIEKTAGFIAKQGSQMEIVIKTKQKDNSQFDFLNYTNVLNKYYHHLIKLIKCGKYAPKPALRKPKPKFGEEGYLHPSLSNEQVSETITSENFLESVRSKLPAGQIANTAYAKLLSNMAKHTSRSNSPAPQQQLQQQQQQQPILEKGGYGAQHGHYPQQAQYNENSTYGAYGLPASQPPVPGSEPVTLPKPSSPSQPPPPGTGDPPALAQPQPQPPARRPHPRLPGLLHPDEYDDDDDDDDEEDDPHASRAVVMPTAQIQPIIDKMANYVARNGLEFEVTVRNKNDPRFEFLHESHHYYPYYLQKKENFLKVIEADRQQSKAVSFSIKAKEAESGSGRPPLSALLADDDSSEEEKEEDRQEADGEPMEEEAGGPGEPPPPSVEDPRPPRPPPQAVTAEDALKNRLAAAAREKLASASKEDHVKAERKRKAAMFAAMLKGAAPAPAPAEKVAETPVGPPAAAPPSPPLSQPNSPHSPPPTAQPAQPQPAPAQPPPRVSNAPPVRAARPHKQRSPHRRKRSRTPPTSYAMLNRGISPRPPMQDRAMSPHKSKRSKRSRSRTRRSRSRSRWSRSPSRHRSHKSSKSHKKSKRRSRSRSRTRPSKKRSRSRSQKRSRRSRSSSRSRRRRSRSKDRSHKSSRKSKSKPSSRSSEMLSMKKAEESDSSSSSAAAAAVAGGTDSESETERLRQAALDSEAANLRAKALASNGLLGRSEVHGLPGSEYVIQPEAAPV